jgi:hypothetical protein
VRLQWLYEHRRSAMAGTVATVAALSDGMVQLYVAQTLDWLLQVDVNCDAVLAAQAASLSSPVPGAFEQQHAIACACLALAIKLHHIEFDVPIDPTWREMALAVSGCGMAGDDNRERLSTLTRLIGAVESALLHSVEFGARRVCDVVTVLDALCAATATIGAMGQSATDDVNCVVVDERKTATAAALARAMATLHQRDFVERFGEAVYLMSVTYTRSFVCYSPWVRAMAAFCMLHSLHGTGGGGCGDSGLLLSPSITDRLQHFCPSPFADDSMERVAHLLANPAFAVIRTNFVD